MNIDQFKEIILEEQAFWLNVSQYPNTTVRVSLVVICNVS